MTVYVNIGLRLLIYTHAYLSSTRSYRCGLPAAWCSKRPDHRGRASVHAAIREDSERHVSRHERARFVHDDGGAAPSLTRRKQSAALADDVVASDDDRRQDGARGHRRGVDEPHRAQPPRRGDRHARGAEHRHGDGGGPQRLSRASHGTMTAAPVVSTYWRPGKCLTAISISCSSKTKRLCAKRSPSS